MKKSYIFIGVGVVILIFLIFCGLYGHKQEKKEHYVAINKSLLAHALSYGKKNAGLTTYEFEKPWTVDLGYQIGKGYATLLTPFLRIALLKRDAVRNKENLDTSLENNIYSQEIGIIHFLVTMYGNSPGFARRIKAFLIYKKQIIKPKFIYFPSYGQMGRDYTQISNGEIKFPRNNIPDNAIITLVVQIEPNPSDKWENNPSWEKTHTAKFKFKMSKYR
ncbi:MAG: hypothetical protein M1501_03525 [Candidatus Omnitrophica bacterium]|nr:hypothetical protein [Candidatus Omnitrophota bacterium]